MTEPGKIAQPVEVSELLETLWKDGEYEKREPTPHEYNASMVWDCHRKTYYRRTGVPEEEPLPHGLFESGRAAEALFIRALKRAYGEDNVMGKVTPWDGQPWVRVEIPNGDGPPIIVRGKPDALVLRHNLKVWILYEVKSKSSVKDFTDWSLHHKYQGAIYWKALAPEHYKLLYLGRGDYDQAKEFDMQVTEEDWKAIEDWYRLLDVYLTYQLLPPPIPTESWNCGTEAKPYCPFRDICKKDSPESWDGNKSPGELIWRKEREANTGQTI